MKVRLVFISGIILCFMYLSRHFILDDGLIYARYISNALHGSGLVFNAGEKINALTSPLFAYLLLFTSWVLHGHVILAEQILFGGFFAGSCFLGERLVPYSGIALSVMVYFYFLIGMESALFLFLLILAVTLYIGSRLNWIPLVLMLTLLTRFEGGLLIPIVGWHLWRQRKFPSIAAYLPAAALLLLYSFLNHFWYGAFLPSSTISKFQQGFSGYWGWWPTAFLRAHAWAIMGPGIFRKTFYIIPIVAVLAFVGRKALLHSRMNDVVVPFCVSLTAFYVLFNIPNYHWYYAPLIFFAVIYAVQAVPKRGLTLAGMIAILLLEGLTNIFVMRGQGPNPDYVQIALWIRNNTAQNATVASVEVGQIGWYSDRHLIDILGLTYPKNAAHIGHRDLSSWLGEDHPDYIVVHKPALIYEKVAVASPDYKELPVHFDNVYLLKREVGSAESALSPH